jgi:hypothetical protein
MSSARFFGVMLLIVTIVGSISYSQDRATRGRQPATQGQTPAQADGARVHDPAAEAVRPTAVEQNRPEQQITEHDRSPLFDITKPAPITGALKPQAKEGRLLGFDFSRDPLNSDRPMQSGKEIQEKETAARPQVTSAQRELL